ncbi:hypothetical protein QBC40DRAFT_254303 [Triangularia verruculosa]|uniref:Uncharacterized protein n=1 Tax=Triangularia verruculosa TaxID=2587418 RepID=A0AAN7AUU1_9PEZI|nr:hypothetical protein QBC40DRAFT_254303 [Triangularia verruculosa]
MANAPGGKAVDWTNPPPLGLEMIERRPGSSAGVRLGTFARRLFWRAYSASEVATPDDDGADAVTKGAIPRPVEHVPRDLGDSAEEDAADDPGAWTQNSQGPLPASMPGSEPDDYDSDATEVVDSDAAEVEASNAAEGEDNHPGPQPPRPGPPDTVSEGANTAASSPPQQPKLSKYERELQAASKINKEGLLLQGDRQSYALVARGAGSAAALFQRGRGAGRQQKPRDAKLFERKPP